MVVGSAAGSSFEKIDRHRRFKLNTENLLLRRAIKDILVVGAISALAAPAAFAADDSTTTTTTTSTTTDNQSTAQLGKIEVTGTRIKRTDVETAQPVTIITTQ